MRDFRQKAARTQERKYGLNGLASHGDDDGPDGYRNVTWESYKAAHQPEENEEVTTERAKEMLALLRSINTTLTGMNGRVGYIANDGMKVPNVPKAE